MPEDQTDSGDTMKTIAIIDDDIHIGDMLEEILTKEGYSVFRAYSGTEALYLLSNKKMDLVLLDLMLPGLSGEEVLPHIGKIPVIVLSAKVDVQDKVNLLLGGAADYMTKPFLPLELVARIKAQLRRYKRYNSPSVQETEEVLTHKGLVLNKKTRECILNERPLSLTPTEFEILAFLCEKKGEVVSSEELFHHIWKDEYYSKNNNTITVHIRHLREKMQDSFEKPKYIKTVWGCGYKLES